MIVIAKNNTDSDIYLAKLEGTTLFTSGQLDMHDRFELAEYNNEPQFVDLVTNGDIIINDGTSDLSISDGLDYIQSATVETAKSFAFQAAGNPDLQFAFHGADSSTHFFSKCRKINWTVVKRFIFRGLDNIPTPTSIKQ